MGNQGNVQNQRCPAVARFVFKHPLRLCAQKAAEPFTGAIEFRLLIPFEAETLTLSLARALQRL